MSGRKWSVEEDKICCKVCVEEYVINKKKTTISDCIQIIKENPCMAEIDEHSIRMKIQNIKSVLNNLEKFEIQNSLEIAPLNNSSKQMKNCLINEIFEQKFVVYLNEHYKLETESGNKSSAYSYKNKIMKVLKEEQCTFKELAENIDKFIADYDKGGCKEMQGSESHKTVINSLKAFKNFLKTEIDKNMIIQGD